jgi:hypothetical protein
VNCLYRDCIVTQLGCVVVGKGGFAFEPLVIDVDAIVQNGAAG